MKHILHTSAVTALMYTACIFAFSCFAAMHAEAQTNTLISYPEPVPGSTPMTFLPGLVSTDSTEFNSAFSPDGKSFYFSRKINGQLKIHVSWFDGKNWTNPVLAPFSNNKYSNADPAFAADGKLYFISNRPKNGSDAPSNYDIWFCKPLAEGRWSEPENLQIVNTDSNEYYISFSKNGNLYFASDRSGGFGEEDIYVSRLVNGKYTKPENIGAAINSLKSEYDPCISPDEDFIIFTSSNREGGFGGADLYYAKSKDGKNWTSPVNLGKNFNTPSREYCSYLSPDGKYFFFSGGGDVKWVSIRAIDALVR
jgi:Tol biopolymer transport system component